MAYGILCEVMQHVDTALIVGCYIAIITLYVWTFKTVSGVVNMQHKHETEANKHVKSEDLVYRDVCNLQTKHFQAQIDDVKVDMNEIKIRLKEVKTGMAQGFSEVKDLLRSK